MRSGLTGRVGKIRAVVPEGCHACRGWPLVRFLREGEPGPPTVCAACGRGWHGLTRVHVVVAVESSDADG